LAKAAQVESDRTHIAAIADAKRACGFAQEGIIPEHLLGQADRKANGGFGGFLNGAERGNAGRGGREAAADLDGHADIRAGDL
jgi:hypothetical protein